MRRFKINSMFKKELKTGMRSMRIPLTLLGYNGILALIGLLFFYAVFQQANYGGIDNSQILGVYMVLACMEFALVLFVIPAYTSSAISGERERQTLEILLTTTMKPSQIIRGKLMASMSTVLLLVFSSLPILSLVFSIGGVSVMDLMQFGLLILVASVFVGSLGLLFSVWFRKTAVATVMTYGMLVFLGMGTMAIVAIVFVLMRQYYEAQYFAGVISSYPDTDLGYGVCILLLNPAVTIASLLMGQFGGADDFRRIITEFGTVPEFVTSNWFLISLAAQAIVSAAVLALGSYLLNPLNRKSKGRRSKKKKKNDMAVQGA